jgi:predicted ATPase/DNA-binding SARP family transcriptional activator
VRYRYRVLGTTQALADDGTAAPVSGARLRALLTALALHAGHSARPGELAAQVWDGDPPAEETAAVQALVGRLRRALGHDAVLSADGGYRLAADRDDVDLHRFERLTGEGTRALADGDAAGAAALLDEALGLWRGPALADLPDGGGARAVRARARHLEARRARLAAELALGHAARALPALGELAAEHPLDEPLQALRLRALRDAGRPAEALAGYAEVRAALADALGTGPGPELRALHAELLRGDPAPAPVPGPPTRPAPARVRGNLPARLTSFVGREADLRLLRRDLADARLVTLLGPGGSGKTRLSLEAAEAGAADWPDGVWVAELAPVRDPATVAETVLTAVGARQTVLRGTAAEGLRAAADTSRDVLAQLAEHCGTRRMLLVLDNCEHLVEAAAGLAEALLLQCPHVTVLATSRERLGVPGERLRPVEPLPGPTALRLLADRGAAARPGFDVAQDPAACTEICRRLDGLPLAIELAAARLRALTPRALADRLDDRFRLLTGGSRTVLPRQQTLRAVVDWSWDLLTPAERAVLRRLSVFSGGCALEEAETVCADSSSVEEGDVAAILAALVDKSLVLAAPDDPAPDDPAGAGRMRYRLLETVAEYATERLAEAGESDAVAHRHLVAYRELARTTDDLLHGPDQVRHLDRLESEHDNIRAALRRAVATGAEHEALCLVHAMGWFWQIRNHRADARNWARAAAALGPDPFAPPVAPAPPMPRRCTDAPPPMDDALLQEARRGVRMMLLADEESGWSKDHRDPAVKQLLDGVVAAYATKPALPQTCRLPGLLWFLAPMMTGRFDLLLDAVEATVEGCRAHGHDWELGMALQLRAKVGNDIAEARDRAAADADEALEVFTRLGDAWGIAEALAGRGEARELRGAYTEAAEDYCRAVDYALGLRAHAQVPVLKARLGSALLETGDPDDEAEGERLLVEAVRESDEAADRPNFATLQYALRLGRRGRTEEARELLRPMAEEFADRPPQLFGGMVEGILAWLHVAEGDPRTGLEVLRRALPKLTDPMANLVAPTLLYGQFLTAAWALAGLGRAEDAVRLVAAFDAAVRTRVPQGHVPHATERHLRAHALAAIEAAGLSEADHARAHAEGGGLSPQEATALVGRDTD